MCGKMKNKTLSQIQRERNEWVAINFPHQTDVEDCIFGAVEEIGELCHHFLKRKQGIRGTQEEHTAEILDAACDTIIFLLGVFTHEGRDAGVTLTEVWEQVRDRNWLENKEDGKVEAASQTITEGLDLSRYPLRAEDADQLRHHNLD